MSMARFGRRRWSVSADVDGRFRTKPMGHFGRCRWPYELSTVGSHRGRRSFGEPIPGATLCLQRGYPCER
jgi:hypothetical protein